MKMVNMLINAIGAIFKLSTVKKQEYDFGAGNPRLSSLMIPNGNTHSKEVMLCEKCTSEDFDFYQKKMFRKNKAEYKRREKLHQDQGGGCYRINGKIVH